MDRIAEIAIPDYAFNVSAFHIERAWMLLNAAHIAHDLSGKVDRNTLAVAMRALGEAGAALQVQKCRQACHAHA